MGQTRAGGCSAHAISAKVSHLKDPWDWHAIDVLHAAAVVRVDMDNLEVHGHFAKCRKDPQLQDGPDRNPVKSMKFHDSDTEAPQCGQGGRCQNRVFRAFDIHLEQKIGLARDA